MDLGPYIQGAIVWVPAIAHSGTGEEVNPTLCTGKYYKVGTIASTPLAFNQFDSETGVYYSAIDTSGLGVGVYMVLTEALVAGVNKNANHIFQVIAAGATAITLDAVAIGDCLSVDGMKALIDTSAYTDTQLQWHLDLAFGKITSMLGHAFGKAFRIYHNETVAATGATITIDTTKVRLTITGGGNAGDYDYTFAAYPYIGDLITAINDEAVGFVAALLGVVPYDQPSANLKALAATSVFGFASRITAQFKQWTECLSGDNQHTLQTRLPIRSVVSVVEDGTTLAADDYQTQLYGVIKACCEGGGDSCYKAGYWSCRGVCNVCLTYIPRWFGLCPEAFIDALLGFAQVALEAKADGHYQSEQIGDYRYAKGKLNDSYAAYYQGLLDFEAAPKFI